MRRDRKASWHRWTPGGQGEASSRAMGQYLGRGGVVNRARCDHSASLVAPFLGSHLSPKGDGVLKPGDSVGHINGGDNSQDITISTGEQEKCCWTQCPWEIILDCLVGSEVNNHKKYQAQKRSGT